MGTLFKTVIFGSLLLTFFAPSVAMADSSPVLLIETGPSDKPEYRRMVYVKYLSGNDVSANYKAYNRREFINLIDKGVSDRVEQCARGMATSLSEIIAFEKDEDKRKRRGQAPETRSFCIKNVGNWSAKNKDVYLDPIFASMPYVKGGR
ncbi:MAG: hypothetical protein V3U57_03000 [Robiginitomaculum sp.]